MFLHRSWPAALLALVGAAFDARADSVVESPPGAASLQASLDFQVTIPPSLYLRVGTGNAAYTANPTKNGVQFNVPAASIGNGVAIAAQGTDGDRGNGRLTVRWFNNFGASTQVSIGVTGVMHNGAAGNTIPWSEILVDVSPLPTGTAGFDNGGAQHPASVAPGVIATTLGGAEAIWTYTYKNSGVLPSGTYGGPARNGRITYTATAV